MASDVVANTRAMGSQAALSAGVAEVGGLRRDGPGCSAQSGRWPLKDATCIRVLRRSMLAGGLSCDGSLTPAYATEWLCDREILARHGWC